MDATDYLKILINTGIKKFKVLGFTEEDAKALTIGFLNQNSVDNTFLKEVYAQETNKETEKSG